jgi:hypothetical protein
VMVTAPKRSDYSKSHVQPRTIAAGLTHADYSRQSWWKRLGA